MGKAFVAKLAKEGARDPEALAAWIGRKKHGKAAFAKLAAKGRKSDGSSDRKASPSSAAPAAGGISEAKLEAGRRQARAMSDSTLRNLRAGLVGKRDDLSRAQRQVLDAEMRRRREAEKEERAKAKERAERSRERTRQRIQREAEERQEREDRARAWQEQQEARRRAEQEATERKRAERQQKLTAAAETSDRNIETAQRAAAAQAKGKTPDALRDEAKAATEAVTAYNHRDTVRNGRPGYIGVGSPEYDHDEGARMNERAAAAYRVAADAESDQSARRSLEFAANQHAAAAQRHRAHATGAFDREAERPGDLTEREALTQASMAPSSARDAVQSVERAKARRAEAAREAQERAASNAAMQERVNAGATGRSLRRKTMTKDERSLVNNAVNRLLTDDAAFQQARAYEDESAQTNRVDVLRSRAFHKAREQRVKNGWSVPGEDNPTPSTPNAAPSRRDADADARPETGTDAQQRAVAERIDQALPQIRALTRGARGGSITMGRRSEGVEGMRLRRMSDADLDRNLALVDAVGRAASDYGIRLSRTDNSMLYDVGHALRSERARRRSR